MDFPFDAVIFDLDGTLADTVPDIKAALNAALGRLGRAPLDEDRVRALVGHGARRLVGRGLEESGDAPEPLVDRGLALFLEYYGRHLCVGTRAYPGADAALRGIADLGVAAALCTNKPERLARGLVEALGWARHFAAIVGGDSLEQRKPDPRPLSEAVARAGGGRAVFVGDSVVDAETARAAGLPFVAVSFGYGDRPVDGLGADLVIDRFEALLPALRRLGE